MYQDKIGKGSKILDAEKLFTQGNLKLTGVDYDMAISGEGFFQVSNTKVSPAEVFYTRAGNFRMGTDGKLTDAAGNAVLGFAMSTVPDTANASSVHDTAFEFFDTSAYSDNAKKFNNLTHTKMGDSKVVKYNDSFKSIILKTSDYSASAEAQKDQDIVNGHAVITVGTLISNVETALAEYRSALSVYQNDPTGDSKEPKRQKHTIDITNGFDGTTANKLDASFTFEGNTVTVTVADQESVSYLDKDGNTVTIDVADNDTAKQALVHKINADPLLRKHVIARITGGNVVVEPKFIEKSVTVALTDHGTTSSDTIVANERGKGFKALEAARTDMFTYLRMANANGLEMTLDTDLSGRPSKEIQLRLDYAKVTDSPFGDFKIDKDGVIQMLQGGAYFAVGQVALVKFNNNRGLEPVGDNMYRANESVTGIPYYKPYNNSIGKIEGSTLELSNSDLSESLVNLMVFQRAFEANAKTITTSDKLLQTLINLKR
jgi:flagellar hook protein FlgE